ncbi:MAG TPA: amidohydrolase family protein, partial [Chthonomonadaceae bacterium]|nr:amidohydrolase family protein [Chthonomonadaceae bacterium]
MNDSPQIIRARWVLPISGPPLEDGEVVVVGGRIAEARPASPSPSDTVRDFGDAIIMPGLVNIHTHLDYTLMRGLLEDREFFPWIRELTARAGTLTPEDWVASATWGAAEAVAGGITTLGDCTFSGAALAGAKALGLGGTIYQEVFGIDELHTVETIVEELQAKVAKLRAESAGSRLSVGISPHAPYTVRPALFRALADYARRDDLPVCIHAAESQAEMELLRSGTGPIADMFARREIVWEPPGGSTVAYLDTLGILGPKTLLVHGIQLSAGDRALCRQHEVAWAHCPKSNAKLGNGIASFGLLSEASAKIGLGSDSVASNNTMDLFEEMRFAVLVQRGARRRMEGLGAKEAVTLATLGGAQALGLQNEIGTLEPGRRADLCVVRLGDLHATPAYDPYNALVYAARASDVVATYIGGALKYDTTRSLPPLERFPHINLTPLRSQLDALARRMHQ